MRSQTRLFDTVGALSVICWVLILGSFVYQEYLSAPPETTSTAISTSNAITITEGQSWFVLSRENKDVGFIHESRTRVDESWLFEHEMVMQVELAGSLQLLKTHTRATLDSTGILQKFQGDMNSFMGTFTATGEVADNTIHVDVDLGQRSFSRDIPLNAPPKLSNTAINQLVANPELLKENQRYEHEYFDPMQQQMSTLAYRYIEQKEVEVYGNTFQAYHFRQELMGDELDVYVNADGEVLIQEFPMKTVASQLPDTLGKSHTSGLRKKLEKETRSAPQLPSPSNKPSEAQGINGMLKNISSLMKTSASDTPADMGTSSDSDM